MRQLELEELELEEVIQNHDNENVRTTGQGEARHGKYR
jgi:hypothetical protein